jgi:uncharacterized protein (TIGR00106 family)
MARERSTRAGRARPASEPEPARRTGAREALLEFSMTPLDKGPSVSAYVSRSLDVVDQSGIPYRLNPMGTVIEGTWEEVLGVVTQCFETMRQDCERISVAIKIDWRRGHSGRLTGKIASVERHLGRRLET